MLNLYYVYVSYYRGIVVYVGKGKGLRLEHTVNGESGNKVLNEFYFRNMYFNDFPLYTTKVQDFRTEREALSYERDMIMKHQPVANSTTRFWVEKGMSMFLTKKLRKIFNNEKITSDLILTKYDEDLIYTKFGLPCEVRSKSFPEFLEVCENGNVRLVDSILKHFPTKKSKYVFSENKIPSDVFKNTTFEDFYKSLESFETFTQHRLEAKEIPNTITLSNVDVDYSDVVQIKWERNVRLVLLRKGFPDNFEDAFGYLQISKKKGYHFTYKESDNIKAVSLTKLNRLDFSDFCKTRVS